MSCYQVDPLNDPRWACLIKRHSSSSVFHSLAWLQALHRTYGYKPVVYTTSPPNQELRDALLLCDIHSWFTGRRAVSLPFSDHCEPLYESQERLIELLLFLKRKIDQDNWKYVELRPITCKLSQLNGEIGFLPSAQYHFHKLNLRVSLEELFRSFDKDSVQRRIRRADRGGLVEKCGSSEDLLRDFYALFVMTRSRHRIPPHPIEWFQNLGACAGEEMQIRVAYRDAVPIASILTLRFKDIVYYKYGCSNVEFNRYAAMPWLLWKAIEAAKSGQATQFDMGRTEEDGGGLLAFKNHWVQPESLIYWQFPFAPRSTSSEAWRMKMAKQAFSYMPEKLLIAIGRLAYRHIG